MTVRSSRSHIQLDAAVTTQFRALGATQISADQFTDAIPLPTQSGAYWHSASGEVPYDHVAIGIAIEQIDLNAGAPIALRVMVDDVATMNNNPVTVAGAACSATGNYKMIVSAKDIHKLDPDFSSGQRFMAIHVDLAAGQSLVFGAWLAG